MGRLELSTILRIVLLLGFALLSLKRGTDAIKTGRVYRALGVSSAIRSENPFSFWLVVTGYFSCAMVMIVLIIDSLGLLRD